MEQQRGPGGGAWRVAGAVRSCARRIYLCDRQELGASKLESQNCVARDNPGLVEGVWAFDGSRVEMIGQKRGGVPLPAGARMP